MLRSTFNKGPLPGLQRADRTVRHGRRRKDFDEMAASRRSGQVLCRESRQRRVSDTRWTVAAGQADRRAEAPVLPVFAVVQERAALHREVDTTTVADANLPRNETAIPGCWVGLNCN